MANSVIINNLKNKVLKDIINNDEIVLAIDSPDKDKPDWDSTCMIDNPTNIDNGFTPLLFKQFHNGTLIDIVTTFICVKIDLSSNFNDALFSKVIIDVWIVSHNKHLRIDNIPKVTYNRCDYIGSLVDNMINNTYESYGKFKLISSIENPYNENFYYRRLTFEGRDLNYSLCNEE